MGSSEGQCCVVGAAREDVLAQTCRRAESVTAVLDRLRASLAKASVSRHPVVDQSTAENGFVALGAVTAALRDVRTIAARAIAAPKNPSLR